VVRGRGQEMDSTVGGEAVVEVYGTNSGGTVLAVGDG